MWAYFQAIIKNTQASFGKLLDFEVTAFWPLCEYQYKELLCNITYNMCVFEDVRNFKVFESNQYILMYSYCVYNFL